MRILPKKESMVNFFHSIRFRLSLWFGLALAVILLIFGAFVYYRQTRDSYDLAAARLAVRVSQFQVILQQSMTDGSVLRMPGLSSRSIELREGEVIVLVDHTGQVASFYGPVSQKDADALASIAAQQEPNTRISVYSLKTGPGNQTVRYLFISSPVAIENHLIGWVTLGQQLDPDNLLGRLLLTLLIAGIVTLAGALAGGYWLADRALRPVHAITKTAQAISETDLSRRLNIRSRDELGELANTFDQMLDRLQAAFIRQRQFTADVSHELRTPLTIIGLEADRALTSGRSNGDFRQAVEVIQSENQFMSRMVDQLLTLARMDAGQMNIQKEHLDLSDLALEVVERYAPIAEKNDTELRTGELPELPILGDRQTLRQMISNLVDNAIKYTTASQDRWVSVETGRCDAGEQPTAWIKVSDHGPGIPAEYLEHIFDRFYRVDKARSHNQEKLGGEDAIPGSGLGLAIVQWVVQIHGGKISVSSQPGQGTTFEVSLPLDQV
jgi:heavy metal sensor kinase